jgi:hypothetical protein
MKSSKFNSDFHVMDRTFKIMFGVVVGFIAVVFIAVIAFWIFMAATVVKASDQVEQRGLKAVIEEIWCGPEKKCM